MDEPSYVYIWACHEDERQLCLMELRALLDVREIDDQMRYVESKVDVMPSRSPFLKMRIAVQAQHSKLDGLIEQAAKLDIGGGTFKVRYADAGDYLSMIRPEYDDQRIIERLVGAVMKGKADMRRPDKLLGVAFACGRWVLGDAVEGEAVWLKHNDKPRPYSTALSTRVARAVANIAVPHPSETLEAVDPCCGIGTVIIEALSMGIRMRGFDRNPLAAIGARENLSYFGYSPSLIVKADMLELDGQYAAAVLDLPYNLCSKLPEEEERAMLRALAGLAPRAVVIATAPLDGKLGQAGWSIQDRCEVRKSQFVRYVYLVECC
ncbi:TRM11 family SAM-dependent methyltransferase [Paenibacillus xylaniclasticus]|uniref:TRM11 family SAM-dependent methyltransferase n=1 Tax=Paenibacillus xylaniclasticus TaxID=588083 RepID=UPI000FD8A30F|nr:MULTISPECIES: RNA methyltransferase [Paenibacillus]GFN33098.1 methyltransferase [Paenibacillus curdlanolyticus]